MSEEETINEEAEEAAQAQPTITIAEKQSPGTTANAAPTITIAEKTN